MTSWSSRKFAARLRMVMPALLFAHRLLSSCRWGNSSVANSLGTMTPREHLLLGCHSHVNPAVCMQTLVKLPLRHKRLAESLVQEQPSRQGFANLNELLVWLWPFTVVSERRCRTVCMWLHNKLAGIQQGGCRHLGTASLLWPPVQLCHEVACTAAAKSQMQAYMGCITS